MENTSNISESKLERIVSLVSESEIASIKGTVSGLITIINDPKSTVRELKEVIEVDPPLTARVLKVANSAYYAPRKPISEIEQAVIWIGFDALKEIALSQKIAEIYDKDESFEGYSRMALWEHSVAVALTGKMIFRREFSERGEAVYAAGLLHDIGIIIADQFMNDIFRYALICTKVKNKSFTDVEQEVIGLSHGQIGAAIAKSWDFPPELCQAIGNHHSKTLFLGSDDIKTDMTLFVANYLCQEEGFGFVDSSLKDKEVFINYIRQLSLKPIALNLIMKEVRSELKKMKDKGFF
jgi:putative nucleotidyltransferase with HDIG domain